MVVLLVLCLALPLGVVQAAAPPYMPQIFHGEVTIGDGISALDGTIVSASIDEVVYASTTTSGGEYLLEVPGEDPAESGKQGGEPGDTVVFKVGVEVAASVTFDQGMVTLLPLSITGPPPVTLILIAVTPETASIQIGLTRQFTATGTYSNETTDNITDQATWASSDPAVATVAAGLASGVAEGDTTITATLDEIIDSATLTVTVAPPSNGGAPSPTYYYTETNLFGTEASFRISRTGEILKTIEATSADGNLTITIPKDTVALDKDGKRLASLETAVDESPPDPPADANIIGLAYDFGPDGATFDPAITLEYTYDPDALPEGVDEEDLVLAYYDEATGEWVELDCVVDTENNIITASVPHFTTFAIIGVVPVVVPPAPAAFSVSSLSVLPAEVEPGETVTIAVSVANIGGKSGSYTVVLKIDGVKEDEERVTVTAGSSQTVSFSVTKEEADSYTVTVDGLSSSFTVAPVVVPPTPPAFSVSYLSVSPRTEVEPGETVAITVLVANAGGESGSYTVVLKIDGAKEAEETVTVAAGESQDVSFSVTREEADSYTVAVDGLSGSFTVVAPPEEEEEEEEEEVPTEPGFNWPLYGGIIGGVIVVGLGVFFWMRRRRAY